MAPEGAIKQTGLRERKKARTRQHIADTAARLFAAHGFDRVSIVDVARAAEVSDQTVYNYFPAKQDLVLDRAEEIRERYGRVVLERPDGASPASVLRPLVAEDIERYRRADPRLARGEFPAQCVESAHLRRFALEARDQQADTVSASITSTCPSMDPIVARAHAAALVSVIQTITDRIGASILAGGPAGAVAAEMTRSAAIAFDDLDRAFHISTSSLEGANP